MKLKYYLRGLGIGIIVTTIILSISFSNRETEISEEEIIARAMQLGMVMQEDTELQTATEMLQEELSRTDQDADEVEVQTEFIESIGTETTEVDTQLGDTELESTQENTELQDDETDVQSEATEMQDTENEMTAETTETEESTDTTASRPVRTEGTYRLVINKGDVCRVVCEKLAENGIIEDAEALRKHLFEIGYANSLSTGKYDIPYGLTMEEVAQVIKAGPIEK